MTNSERRPGERAVRTVRRNPSQFFLKIRPWTLTFLKQGSRVVRFDILESGQTSSARKLDQPSGARSESTFPILRGVVDSPAKKPPGGGLLRQRRQMAD